MVVDAPALDDRALDDRALDDGALDEGAGVVDRVFSALGDPTRRDILRRASAGEHSVSSLAGAYPMSFAAVQKHVAVLERAGLVTKRRRGREQLVRTDVTTIRAVTRLLAGLEEQWRDRLDRFGEVLADDERSTTCP